MWCVSSSFCWFSPLLRMLTFSCCRHGGYCCQEIDFDGAMCKEREESFRAYYHRKFSTPRGSKRRQAVNVECLSVIEGMPKMASMLHALDADGKHAYLIPELCKFVELPETVRRALPVLCGYGMIFRACLCVNGWCLSTL